MFLLEYYSQLDELIKPLKKQVNSFYFVNNQKKKFTYKINYLGKAQYIIDINNEKKEIRTKEKLLEYIKHHLKKNKFKEQSIWDISLDIEKFSLSSILESITDTLTDIEIHSIACDIVEALNIAKQYFNNCVEITKSYIKVFGSGLKTQMGNLIDDFMIYNGFSLGLLGWEKALYSPLNTLSTARAMRKDKVHSTEIWQKTGWEKGKDNKWRFEIDDADAKINVRPLSEIKYLGDLLDFPLLYENYPVLKVIEIKYANEFTSSCCVRNKDGYPQIVLNRSKTFFTDMSLEDIEREKENNTINNWDTWYTLSTKYMPYQKEEVALTDKKKEKENLWPEDDSMRVPDWLFKEPEPKKDKHKGEVPLWLKNAFSGKDLLPEENEENDKTKHLSYADRREARRKKVEEKMQKEKEQREQQVKETKEYCKKEIDKLKKFDQRITDKMIESLIPGTYIEDYKNVFKEKLQDYISEASRPDCLQDKKWNKVLVAYDNLSSYIISLELMRRFRGFKKIEEDVFLWPKGEVETSKGHRYRWFFSDKASLSTVLHEVQHLIQELEGFASGGNTTIPETQYMDKVNEQIKTEESIYFKKNENRRQLKHDLKKRTDIGSIVKIEELKEYDKLYSLYDPKALSAIKREVLKLEKEKAKEIGLDVYRRLAGEVEARNVSRRNKLSSEQKKLLKPEDTEDTKRTKQIIIEEISDMKKISLD